MCSVLLLRETHWQHCGRCAPRAKTITGVVLRFRGRHTILTTFEGKFRTGNPQKRFFHVVCCMLPAVAQLQNQMCLFTVAASPLCSHCESRTKAFNLLLLFCFPCSSHAPCTVCNCCVSTTVRHWVLSPAVFCSSMTLRECSMRIAFLGALCTAMVLCPGRLAAVFLCFVFVFSNCFPFNLAFVSVKFHTEKLQHCTFSRSRVWFGEVGMPRPRLSQTSPPRTPQEHQKKH